MRVLVSVGTDHHPFDRLIGWIEKWLTQNPSDEATIQYGFSRAPVVGTSVSMLPRTEMSRAMADADLVVVSCGPGAVMDARRAGKLPIVVPRRRALGEHVDDHQLAFANHLHDVGSAKCVTSETEFIDALTAAAANPAIFATSINDVDPSGVAEVGRQIDRLVLG